jgi:hypothetical protein
VQRLAEDERAPFMSRIDRASAAIESGRLYLALYELEPAWEHTFASAFARDAGASDIAAFTARWKAAGEPRRGAALTAGPVVAEAFASAAETRGPATYRASLPYAQDSDVTSGWYYLGESRAVGAFASFVRALPWPSAPPRPAIRSIAPELDALDAEVTGAYKKMDRSQHPAYVGTSVTLKRARAAEAEQHYAGALLEYLIARYRFATLRAAATAAPPVPSPERLADARARLAPNVDHSIGELFVQMAEAAAARTDAAAQRGAAIILDDVLPAYHAALAPPVSPRRTTDAAPVTITLVRWPFT